MVRGFIGFTNNVAPRKAKMKPKIEPARAFSLPAGKRRQKVVMLVALVTIASTLFLIISIFGQSTFTRTIGSHGTVKAVGVGVYWDYACTTPLSSIGWGMLEPGSSKNVTCYIRNEGNSASTLSMYTSNWNPSNASECMVLSWDYGGQSIDPGEVVQVTFTLSVSASIEGITNFSFDITIVGSG